jgi:hypothetical protein
MKISAAILAFILMLFDALAFLPIQRFPGSVTANVGLR